MASTRNRRLDLHTRPAGRPLAALSATVLRADSGSATVTLWFDLDSDAENLANYFVLWIPRLTELQALEREIRTFLPTFAVHWPAALMKWGIPRRARLPATGRGCIISSSEYLTLGVEASSNGLGALDLTPLVCIQVADNARASWCPWPKASATWQCRAVDCAAIAVHLARIYVGLEVILPRDVRQQLENEYADVPAPPFSRLLT